MEPINYAAALRRGWRLLLVFGVLGAVVAAFLPVKHVKLPKPVLKWKATTVVGSIPSGGSLLGGGLTGEQILFYAQSHDVLQKTAQLAQANVHESIPYYQYQRYLTADLGSPSTGSTTQTTKLKSGKKGPSTVTLTAFTQDAGDAVPLVNDYAAVLSGVINDAASAHAAAVASAKPSTSGTRGAASTATTAPSSSASSDSSDSSDSGSTTPTVQTGFEILQPAIFPTKVPHPTAGRFSSRKVRIPVGFLVGALFGAAVVIVRALLDRRIRTASQAGSSFGYPVLVEIPRRRVRSADERPVPIDVATQPNAPEAEAFRMLRMSVLFEELAKPPLDVDPLALFGNGHGTLGQVGPAPVPALVQAHGTDRRVVLVVSPDGEETRAVVAANLAAVYAEADQRVIVVSTSELGRGGPLPAPSELVAERRIEPTDVEAQLLPSRITNVYRLPLTPFLRNSGQLVSRGKELLEVARGICDVVIVEAPPLLSVHHAEALSRAVDAVVVVAECGTTRLADGKRSAQLLRRIGAPVLGVVVTEVREEADGRRRHARRTRGLPQGPDVGPILALDSGPEGPEQAPTAPVVPEGLRTPPQGVEVMDRSEEPTAPTQA